jgi:membrane fusion protein (multidrug efflux system)
MKKWMAIMLLIALALFGSVIGFNMFKQKKIAEFMANRPEPEFPVTAMVTKAQDWVPTIEAIGFIEPNQGSPSPASCQAPSTASGSNPGHMSKRINCC